MGTIAVKRFPLTKLRGLTTLMRPKQWVKNIFVLAPLLFSGDFLDADAVSHALLATLLFCFASSATYIVNDIRDIEPDRQHPKKSHTRPLAAGIVSIPETIPLLAALYVALILSWFIMSKVVLIIAAYLAISTAYTFILKNQPVIDIFTIALGFVLRVYAGAMALAVPVSSWMFVTTLCLALYLGAIKRRQELVHSGSSARKTLKKYSVHLLDRYAEISASGALLFYSMFVMSTKPELIMTIPLVIFGLFRFWYLVDALNGGESPTDALLTDWQLLCTVALWAAICGHAAWPIRG